MEAKIERRRFVSKIQEVDKAIVKAVRTLGMTMQPADVYSNQKDARPIHSF